ncbi:MFS transporter [Xanthobacteraceae bacterium Astr-EGSB]|uniref:MFS transporter n=1 Tax=Astrobacterium formosum TaxID=3069710 RepID=UPI0027AE5CFB|nr:MFS transporter [Xanthobacteraceae bacterium Astr-EGSB]
MTETTHPAPGGLSREFKVTTLICAAHFVSHFYFLILPPLFVFIRDDFGVSYTELGFALTAFSVVTTLVQTHAGFLVDRVGARLVLIAGLVIGGVSFLIAGLAPSFWVFVAMFGLAGLGNTAYHPADYAVLSHEVAEARIGHAFAAHNFSGMLGGAVAPPVLLVLHGAIGWRGAYVASALLGFAVALVIASTPDISSAKRTAPSADQPRAGLALLTSPVILFNWIYFALLSFIATGLQGYTAVAAKDLFGTPLPVGNTAMAAYLAGTAVGVVMGGVLAARVGRHALVAMTGVTLTGAAAGLAGLVDLGSAGLIAALALAGIASGAAMPSRDLLVREVTPKGSFGTVFGFLSTGFSFAGMVAPLVFGLLMDHGEPRAVFLVTAVACLVGVAAIAAGSRRAEG